MTKQQPSCQRLWATITHESTHALGLRPKQTVIALAKASAVMLAADLGAGTKLSARNQWPGTVAHITPGAVNAEVLVHTPQGAVVDMGLQVGSAAVAQVQASEVVLGVVLGVVD